jgi:hypothetical protein
MAFLSKEIKVVSLVSEETLVCVYILNSREESKKEKGKYRRKRGTQEGRKARQKEGSREK